MMLDTFIERQEFARTFLVYLHLHVSRDVCVLGSVCLWSSLLTWVLAKSLDSRVLTGAAAIAYDVMLQETVGDHPITTALIWKACFQHWKSGDFPPVEPYVTQPDDVGNIVWFAVVFSFYIVRYC